MTNRKRSLNPNFKYQRPVLTDVVPFEVPPSFSNGGFFHFLTKYNVRINLKGEETRVEWECKTNALDAVISVIFGTRSQNANNFHTETIKRDGVEIYQRSWTIVQKWTKPFQFKINHKENDYRQLTVIHPRNQLMVADFYHRNSAQILFQCERSNYSIRRPNSVVKSTKFTDRLHKSAQSKGRDTIEEAGKEYENLGSYFSYKSYSNIFKFYEHYKYHNAEKKFGRLLKLDVSKCFDSIYTHSMPWTTLSSEAVKAGTGSIKQSQATFGGRFDTLMQCMNQGETNGIVIGPEFSRVFAEIILQGVDRKLEDKLTFADQLQHKKDYEIFRYVDDYFIFHNSDANAEKISRHLEHLLKEVKLSLNMAKLERFERPIITKLTVAKNMVSKIFADHLIIEEKEEEPKGGGDAIKFYKLKTQQERLIVDFKTVLVESDVKYKDLLNYTLSAIERRTQKYFIYYEKTPESHQKPNQLTKSMIGILEFCFFVYAASPRVNFSVKLTRIISSIVDGLHRLNVPRDEKHQVFKYAFDNIKRELKSSAQQEYREMEVLYLVLAMKKLGREYCLGQDDLASFLGVEIKKDGSCNRSIPLDYFSVIVALQYIGSRKRYNELRKFIENDVCQTFAKRSAYVNRDAELLMLYLDLQCCPHVDVKTKNTLFGHFSENALDELSIQKSAKYWFTNWENFDLSEELDKKRTREVY